jgi:DNA-binding MarR family transcriptional regulator
MEMGPATAGALAEATGLTTGAITAMLGRLERAGLVARTKDPKDARKVLVTLLPKKHAKAAKVYAAMAHGVHQLFSGYTPNELKFLFRHTRALEEIYKRHTQKR